MSLSLIQGYSSAEEEDEAAGVEGVYSDEDVDNVSASASNITNYKSYVFDLPKSSSNSSDLPSAFDVFSQISGPPDFLNNSVSVEEQPPSAGEVVHHRRRRGGRAEKRDVPTGAVMEAKAQLVGIHERVRSDIEGKPPPSSVSSTTQAGVKRVATATNPNAEDAADLLRMCLQCGIPKTYSSARGMVCPVCGDRPPTDPSLEPKKKASVIKEKEKSKRMKGQSSHGTWKSETEMQLRQQFD